MPRFTLPAVSGETVTSAAAIGALVVRLYYYEGPLFGLG